MRRRTETPQAPGWYPDPETGRLRRFDGRVWTGETRDMPPWTGGGQGASVPPAGLESGEGGRRRFGRRWVVFSVVVGVLFLAVSIKAWNSGPSLPPRTVFDEEYIAAANSKCRASLDPLKDERPKPGSPEGKDPGPNEAVAAQVDKTADSLVAIAADLRGISVAAEDKADIDGWLADWVAYADVGHRYADAVRDDSNRQRDLAGEGTKLAVRADKFALANGLKDCTFS